MCQQHSSLITADPGLCLARMKPKAIVVNASRGPVIDEVAPVAHCQKHNRSGSQSVLVVVSRASILLGWLDGL